MPNNRVCLVPALNGFRGPPQSHYGTAPPGTAAGSGPAGSSSMTFFCVMYPFAIDTSSRVLFGRSNTTTTGWLFHTVAGELLARAGNSTPAGVVVSTAGGFPIAYEGLRVPYLLLASYQNGVMTFWLNGVLVGTTTLGTGFTSAAFPTTVGVNPSSATLWAVSEMISDCGMLDTYDAASFVSALYGNGGPGLSAMWLEDLREGRYLTWPRVAVANSDWYWAGRDAAVGIGTRATWTDRYTAQAMARTGEVQGASFPARPA